MKNREVVKRCGWNQVNDEENHEGIGEDSRYRGLDRVLEGGLVRRV